MKAVYRGNQVRMNTKLVFFQNANSDNTNKQNYKTRISEIIDGVAYNIN